MIFYTSHICKPASLVRLPSTRLSLVCKMEDCAPLQPTFTGYIDSVDDAMTVIKACLQGHLRHLPRQLSHSERDRLIRSGSVFVYEAGCSGFTTWDDGMRWEPVHEHDGICIHRMLGDTAFLRHQGGVLFRKTMNIKIGQCVHCLVAYYDEHNLEL